MSRASILFALLTLAGGCCKFMHKDPSVIASCEASPSVFSCLADSLQEKRGQKEADAERTAREAAAPACDRGDAHSCLIVAVYDERHHGARATIARAYAVACRGDLAFGCYGAGRFEDDAAIALRTLARGCELGEPASCEAAATMDPVHEMKFHEAACWLNDDDACEVAALNWLSGNGVPANRRRAATLLRHA